jgi:hypothetical protein
MAKGRPNKASKPVLPPAPASAASRSTSTRRHPLFGALKGLLRVMPGTDLTKPANPDWGRRQPKCSAQ